MADSLASQAADPFVCCARELPRLGLRVKNIAAGTTVMQPTLHLNLCVIVSRPASEIVGLGRLDRALR
jgi:hypothetical protein